MFFFGVGIIIWFLSLRISQLQKEKRLGRKSKWFYEKVFRNGSLGNNVYIALRMGGICLVALLGLLWFRAVVLEDSTIADIVLSLFLAVTLLPLLVTSIFGSTFGGIPKGGRLALALILLIYCRISELLIFKGSVCGVQYDASVFKTASKISAVILLVSPVIEFGKHSFAHCYWRWCMDKAFFVNGGENRTKFSDLKKLTDSKQIPEYICCTTSNLWTRTDARGLECESDIFVITPSFAGRVDSRDRKRTPPKDVPIAKLNEHLEVANGMAISAAAVSYSMGDLTSSARSMLVLIGLGLGQWVSACPEDDAGSGNLWTLFFRLFQYTVLSSPIGIFCLLAVIYENAGFLGGVFLLFPILLFLRAMKSRFRTTKLLGARIYVPFLAIPFFQVVAQALGMTNNAEPQDIDELYLGDGGHVDNMGLIPLLQAKCDWIIGLDTQDDVDCTLENLLKSLRLARELLGCSFHMKRLTSYDTRINFEPNSDFESALLNHFRVRQRPRFINFHVLYHDKTWGKITYFRQRPQLHNEIEPQLHNEIYSSSVGPLNRPSPFYMMGNWRTHLEEFHHLSYEVRVGGQLQDHDEKELRRIHGLCCECCGDSSPCDLCFGEFPYSALANQFFTPSAFAAYHHEGFMCAYDAFHGTEGKDEEFLFQEGRKVLSFNTKRGPMTVWCPLLEEDKQFNEKVLQKIEIQYQSENRKDLMVGIFNHLFWAIVFAVCVNTKAESMMLHMNDLPVKLRNTLDVVNEAELVQYSCDSDDAEEVLRAHSATHLKVVDLSCSSTDLQRDYQMLGRNYRKFLSKVHTLDVSDCNIGKVTWDSADIFDTFELLQTLNLSQNQITHLRLPDVDYTSLTSLDLSRNDLNEALEDIKVFPSLTWLNLSGNRTITRYDFLESLKRLTYLEATFNRIRELPDIITKLSSLHTLNLSRNNLTSLPDSICDLNSLQNLDLNNNEIDFLPISIGNLAALQTLNLRNNKITFLPDSVGDLKSLQTLDLSDNKITSLPISIGNLSALKTLILDRNLITILPDSIGDLKSLQTLDLSDNKITSLPISIGNLSALKTLILDRNLITILPDSIGDLKSLQTLDLSDNKITSLPISIGNLAALQTLYLRSNQMSSLPDSMCQLKGLETLDLRDNEITFLPISFSRLEGLKKLYLSKNALQEFPEAVIHLVSLEALDLAYNLFDEVPPEISGLVNLHVLRLPKRLRNIPTPTTCNDLFTKLRPFEYTPYDVWSEYV